MATAEELLASLEAFCEAYNRNRRLKEMNRDWDRIVSVEAPDISTGFTLTLQNGELSLKKGRPEHSDLRVEGPSDLLTDLFYGDITPTEPYLKGTLKVFGTEDDVIRLDFISLMIWGE
ncbi:MAG: SCP2 sterol-binding domain-containing protein [Bacillota bacterium]